MEAVAQIACQLNDTFSTDSDVVRTSTVALDRLSLLPSFPFGLLSIATGGESNGQRVAAATYLKNFTRRSVEGNGSDSKVSKEFKNQLMQSLLLADLQVLNVLVETFRVVVVAEFVKQDSWPELVPQLRFAIQNSNLILEGANSQWNTINALTILHTLLRPFQYFLNPKLAKEPVPPQLELIAKEILVPMLAVFNHIVKKDLSTNGFTVIETERILLMVCKCLYFAVRSHMPSALAPNLPSLCCNLIRILDSLSCNVGPTLEDGHLLRLRVGKRSLLIFCALVTRHLKYSNKSMPDIINCTLRIVRHTTNIRKLDFLFEKILSLGFDVISHAVETGLGWRLVSPHFSFLLESAIFPILVLNEKDISEWEEDPDDYMLKNLPSDFGEVLSWREDLFTARESAINLLGVISMSKGPPMMISAKGSASLSKRKKGEKNRDHCYMGELLVFPFLSKFPLPYDANALEAGILDEQVNWHALYNYFGVLMAYGSLENYIRVQKPEYTTTLVRTRVLPLYTGPTCLPYLVASANWVLRKLAPCLPKDMTEDIYSSLLKALAMNDQGDTSWDLVRVSAVGAIAELLANDYPPPKWLPLLRFVIGRIENENDEVLFNLLSSVVEAGIESLAVHIPFAVSSLVGALLKQGHPSLDQRPGLSVFESGIATLAVMVRTWENYILQEVGPTELGEKCKSARTIIGKALSALLQQAWLAPMHSAVEEDEVSPCLLCLVDSSKLLQSVLLSVTGSDVSFELKVPELLLVWADLIADWHDWEESGDLSVFDCIKEVVNLNCKFGLKNFIVGQMPSPPAPPVPRQSIIEGIAAFVSEAISQCSSATWRVCSIVHVLLHVPIFSFETDIVKQSLVSAFSQAAFSRFREVRSNPTSMWKPLLLAISSCYLCHPGTVESVLEKDEDFEIWASALAFACTGSFELALFWKSEMELAVLALAKLVDRLLSLGNPSGLARACFCSLMETAVLLKQVHGGEDTEDEDEETDDDDDGDIEVDNEESEVDDEEMEVDDEDSEDECEETEEEFLERYAKEAAALESGASVKEGDIDDQDHEIELGSLKEVNLQKTVWLLIERYHICLQQQGLPVQLVLKFLGVFPECRLFFPAI
ncbi:uncharacterized protein LOC120015460 isoform X2 [Tripterygium wilfordii]|uniref:uncharacterized protein LOC120015460 isoform X2 n=1 Tax=Tripterygium wilfordii TaxID=458696 RepID=UPI0018F85526|nr:uncharacterized protein LOC120015460 isoform X2 [Tripterygium wilfordii]